jgi:hypothetical protein
MKAAEATAVETTEAAPVETAATESSAGRGNAWHQHRHRGSCGQYDQGFT